MSEHQVQLGSVNRNSFGEPSRRFRESTTQLSGLLRERVSRLDPVVGLVFFDPARNEAFVIEDDGLETIKKRIETDKLAEEMVITAIKRYTTAE